ncbi:MAG: hypothetical protein WC234_00855 [Endomicrobiaceae bacterium]
MKKVLFLILCCAVFAIGCSKAVEEQPAAATETMDQQTTEAVSDNIAVSTDTAENDVTSSTDTI